MKLTLTLPRMLPEMGMRRTWRSRVPGQRANSSVEADPATAHTLRGAAAPASPTVEEIARADAYAAAGGDAY